MAGSVAAEHHLWLNLTEIREKEKVFSHFSTWAIGEAVSSVVEKFRSATSQSAALSSTCQEDEGLLQHSLHLLVQRALLTRKEPTSRSCAPDLDSVQMQARLAPARISSFNACLARFKLGHHVSVSNQNISMISERINYD